jgi:hypothetical protein
MGEERVHMELAKNLKKVPVGWVRLPLSALVKAEWNYKLDDEEKAKKLTANIKRNGQVQNIIVRDLGKGKFEIANGNHRLDSFLELKYKDAVCYNLGKVSQAVAERVAIETNEQSFDPDPIKLGQVIEHIMEEFPREDLLETMPYSDVDFDALIAAGGFNPDDAPPSSDFDPGADETEDRIPVAKVLTSLGILTMPKREVEALAKKMNSDILAWGLGKSDRWRIFEKIGRPQKSSVTKARKKA